MSDRGRPWWTGSPSKEANTPKSKPLLHRPATDTVKVEAVHTNSPVKPPLLSPNGTKTNTCGFNRENGREVVRMKSEPQVNIKNEPISYLENALTKGEFPLDFNLPLMKWEPLTPQNPSISGTSIKREQKHYIPNPYKCAVRGPDGKLKIIAPNHQPRRSGPPPNWHSIYTRDHRPSDAARAWWNADVERALERRKKAYLLTKKNENIPVEVRMERLWQFEVAKDEVRRVITESKWRAEQGIPREIPTVIPVNFGASCSNQYQPGESGSLATSPKLPVRERLGNIVTLDDDEEKTNDTKSEADDDDNNLENSDEVQFIPKDKEEDVAVYTIEDEIDDDMNDSDGGSDNIRVVDEGGPDIIFIQKRQGEVTFLAQVDGRVIKMNRKRKLCVTVSNLVNKRRMTTNNIENVNVDESSHVNEQKSEASVSGVQVGSTCEESSHVNEQKSEASVSGVQVGSTCEESSHVNEQKSEASVSGVQVGNACDVTESAEQETFDINSESESADDMSNTDAEMAIAQEESTAAVDNNCANETTEIEMCNRSKASTEMTYGIAENSYAKEDDVIVGNKPRRNESIEVHSDDSISCVVSLNLENDKPNDMSSGNVEASCISNTIDEEDGDVQVVLESEKQNVVEKDVDVLPIIVDDDDDYVEMEVIGNKVTQDKGIYNKNPSECDVLLIDTDEIDSEHSDVTNYTNKVCEVGASNVNNESCSKMGPIHVERISDSNLPLEKDMVEKSNMGVIADKSAYDILEIDVDSEDDILCEKKAGADPQKLQDVKDINDYSSCEDIEVISSADEGIEVLATTTSQSQEGDDAVACSRSRSNSDNTVSFENEKMKTRHLKQASSDIISRRTRSIGLSEAHNVTNRQSSSRTRKFNVKESPQTLKKSPAQNPSSYSFRNRSKRV